MAESVILATARLAGGVELLSEAPDELHVRAGTKLLLKFPFRFTDLPENIEAYELYLRVALDNEPEEEVSFEAEDIPMRNDDKRGFLVQERTVIAAGEHTLRFTAKVRLDNTARDGGQTSVQEKEIEGTVRVQVR